MLPRIVSTIDAQVKRRLHSSWKFTSIFTQLHGDHDERWPTEVTSIQISVASHTWAVCLVCSVSAVDSLEGLVMLETLDLSHNLISGAEANVKRTHHLLHSPILCTGRWTCFPYRIRPGYHECPILITSWRVVHTLDNSLRLVRVVTSRYKSWVLDNSPGYGPRPYPPLSWS